MYVIVQPQGTLYRSTDAGLNWAKITGGIPTNEIAYTVAFDPRDSNRVYAGTQAGVYRSLDGGANWSAMSLPIGISAVFSVLVNPVAPSTLVLVSGSAVGMVRSVDYGATWEALPGLEAGDTPWLGLLDPLQPGKLHVGSFQDGMHEYLVVPDDVGIAERRGKRVDPGQHVHFASAGAEQGRFGSCGFGPDPDAHFAQRPDIGRNHHDARELHARSLSVVCELVG